MTTRRQFIAGLMATAATGAAQPVPAQPVAGFFTVVGLDQFGRRVTETIPSPTVLSLNSVYGKLLPVPSNPVNPALLAKLYDARRLAKAYGRVSDLMRGS